MADRTDYQQATDPVGLERTRGWFTVI